MATNDSRTDDRDEATKQAHTEAALSKLREMNATRAQALSAEGKAAPPLPDSPYEYSNCNLEVIGVVFYNQVQLWFGYENIQFQGEGGGVGIGKYGSFGTAYFNYPLDQLKTWSARYQVTVVGPLTTLFLWGMEDEVIGSVVCGGVNFFTSIAGGKGEFSQ